MSSVIGARFHWPRQEFFFYLRNGKIVGVVLESTGHGLDTYEFNPKDSAWEVAEELNLEYNKTHLDRASNFIGPPNFYNLYFPRY